MKQILALVTILALFATAAMADVGTVDFGTATTITNASTNATAAVCGTAVAVKSQREIGIQVKLMTSATAADGTIGITIARSFDGTSFETSPLIQLQAGVLGTAGTTQYWYTNLTDILGPCHSIKIVSIQNTNASAIGTNFWVKGCIKTIKAQP